MLKLRAKSSTPIVAQWLIVGLGNPGPEYRWTRHNVGFDAIDKLADRYSIRVKNSKHQSLYGQGEIGGTSVVLAKPLTYMNNSGQSVKSWMKQLDIKPNQVLVITDDIHLPVGIWRLREKGSAGGHNGHKSIINSLGTQEYLRLRIGVGEPMGDQVDFVLGRFDKADAKLIEAAMGYAPDIVEAILNHGVEGAQETVTACNSMTKKGV